MLLIARAAQDDIRAAALWYEQQQQGLGAEFINDIDKSLIRIENAPMQFPFRYLDMRRALVRRFPYAVYFEVLRSGDNLVFHA